MRSRLGFLQASIFQLQATAVVVRRHPTDREGDIHNLDGSSQEAVSSSELAVESATFNEDDRLLVCEDAARSTLARLRSIR